MTSMILIKYPPLMMEDVMTCLVDGCESAAKAAGYCWRHYFRKRRHGDPTKGRTAVGEPMKFVKMAAAYEGDDCLLWPFPAPGYPIVNIGNWKRDYAHRVVCKLVHGRPPKGKPNALHRCGNGHLGCMTPAHLYWGSQKDNVADAVLHGTYSPPPVGKKR